jgi:hypothetical protein
MDTYETQATTKLSVALPDNPRAGIRPMEVLYIVGFFFLFAIYLDATDVAPLVLEERLTQAECQRIKDSAERNARLLSHVLNGGGLVVPGATKVSCKATQLRNS